MANYLEFEARKISYRQTKDGVVVSFLINPHDVPDELATAELQTIYIARLQQNESGSWIEEQASASERPPAVHAAQQRLEETAAPSKPHRDWSSLRLSEQCALRCRDQQFQKWFLGSSYDLHKNDAAQWTVRMIHEALGGSRKLLDDDPVAALKWQNANARYEAWLTTQQHAETYR